MGVIMVARNKISQLMHGYHGISIRNGKTVFLSMPGGMTYTLYLSGTAGYSPTDDEIIRTACRICEGSLPYEEAEPVTE